MQLRKLLISSLALGSVMTAVFGCDDTPLSEDACHEGEIREGAVCITPYAVKVNSVGYLTNRKKYATWVGGVAKFEVRRVNDDKSVLTGTAAGPSSSPDTNEEVYTADLSKLTTTGEYYVKVEGLGQSPPFTVDKSPFQDALVTTMLGFYGQRCGEAVKIDFNERTFKHDECHMAKASLARVGGGSRDDTGGWHDAGDYGKYVVNGAFSVGMLLQAYEHTKSDLRDVAVPIPEKGGKLPDILDESRVELEWLLKTQFDDGSFAHKVTALQFEGVQMPETDKQERFYISASSAATGDAVAALALAARIYADLDSDFAVTCLEAAKKGQAFLDGHPDSLEPDQSDVTTGGYTGGGDGDERVWALAELWETTGEAGFLADLESRLGQNRAGVQFDWANVQNLGLGTYLRSQREGRDANEVAQVAKDFISSAKSIASRASSDAYGRGIGEYYWGINGVLARLSYNLMAANFVEPSADYLDAVHRQLDYLFGYNPYGRSFVTQLGANPAKKPHHRPSQSDGIFPPWPGLLVGGPHSEVFGGGEPKPPALTWEDNDQDYMHNEVAINWNAALAYALLTLSDAETNGPGCPSCLVGGPDGVGGAGGAGGAAP